MAKQSLVSALQINKRQRTRRYRSVPVVFAAQSNFLKVWKVGKDGIEAGTNLVPDSVPRSIARVSVTVVALALSLFVLKSLLSTVFFVLATMGLVYFTFIALNKDEGPRGVGHHLYTKGGGDGGQSRRSQKNHGECAWRIYPLPHLWKNMICLLTDPSVHLDLACLGSTIPSFHRKL
ncbi:hypothetical protein Prudu_022759 [Prunus dulcis]|uniref:Uncharacterized protein n=1 Tax=Prunus dulcis TaxID=3755 RepID=A0A4Y1S272_PRUDU|nr:hypothetical protein Prudu_022759 [Prunus dulcis]